MSSIREIAQCTLLAPLALVFLASGCELKPRTPPLRDRNQRTSKQRTPNLSRRMSLWWKSWVENSTEKQELFKWPRPCSPPRLAKALSGQ